MRLIEGVARVDDVGEFVARLDEIGDDCRCTVQAFDARYVVDREHLERAVELADRAFDRGENVARNRAVEILLYAAGRRQIDRALEIGVDAGETPVVVLVDAETRSAPDHRDEEARDETDHRDEEAREQCAADALSALLEPAETLGEYDPERVRDFFDVGDAELDATAGGLADAVRERVALLDVEK